MYFNNLIQVGLYFPFILIFLLFITSNPGNSQRKRLKLLTSLLICVILLGLVLGYITGIGAKNELHEIVIDIERILAFCLLLILPGFISMINIKLLNTLYLLYIWFAVLYSILVFISIYTVGVGNSAFPGNMFRASTVNITICSCWSFLGLYMYLKSGRIFSLFLCLLTWLICLLSLAKWNLIIILCIPVILFYTLIIKNPKFSHGLKILSALVSIVFLSIIVLNGSLLLSNVAQKAGYDDITHYVNVRVLRDAKSKVHIDRALIPLSEGSGIKDGGRGLVWLDLINRTIDDPITGVGLGSRGLGWMGFNMEDHNMFVTFFSRFGIPLFLLWLFLLWKYFRCVISIVHHSNDKRSYIIYTLSVINFIFQASVGNIWGQLVIAYFIGTSWGIMMRGNGIKD